MHSDKVKAPTVAARELKQIKDILRFYEIVSINS